MVDLRGPEVAHELGDELEGALTILVPGHGREKVARIGKPVRADRSEVGKTKERAVVLAHVTASFAVEELHAKTETARNDGDLLRLHVDQSQLRRQAKATHLRNDQQLAVGAVEVAIDHRSVGDVEVNAAARLRAGIAVARHGDEALDEIRRLARHRRRIPAELVGRNRQLVEAAGEPTVLDLRERTDRKS